MNTLADRRPPPSRSSPDRAGTATAAPGLLAVTGTIGPAEPHAHAAVQVLLVLDGEVMLTDRHGGQHRARAAIIPAGVRPGVGDVNFGLFTLAWDHLLGTFSYDPARRFTSGQLGMAAEPDYPTAYPAQLAEPFRASGACQAEPAVQEQAVR
ncbi:hypothetical protein [Nonomuraea sp. NPDC003214]